jgi:hypothetical protein
MAPSGTGMMGPPSKPAERDNGSEDQMDVLAGTGVDIRAEESYAMSFHSGSFKSQPAFSQSGPNTTGQAFTQFPPGQPSQFYGAGPASQPGQATSQETQDEVAKKVADQAWAAAAMELARSRDHELKNPHMDVIKVWRRIDKIAKDHGLQLNTTENADTRMGKIVPAGQLTSGNVNVQTATGPDGSIMTTSGLFLPEGTALIDQLALMSLATNQRLRILLEDAVALARGRRTASHGVIPPEYADVAEATSVNAGTAVPDGAVRSGWESAVSPYSNPMNRTSKFNYYPGFEG